MARRRVEPFVQRPADDPAGVGVQHNRQINELLAQPDIGDVSYPELVDAGQLHTRGQVQMDAQLVAGVGGDREAPPPQAEQVVLRHQPRYPLAVHGPAFVAQLLGDPAVAVVAAVGQRDPLHLSPQLGLLRARLALLPVAIKPGPAHLGQPAHGLDAEVCLRPHHSDLLVDAVSPHPLTGWR